MNVVKVFVVYFFEHYDDYKRAESFGDVIDVFIDEEQAYKCAVDKFIEMFKENITSYGMEEFDDYDMLTNKENILYHALSYKEKYNIIKDKLYSEILPDAEYTMQPTHQNYFVKEFIVN